MGIGEIAQNSDVAYDEATPRPQAETHVALAEPSATKERTTSEQDTVGVFEGTPRKTTVAQPENTAVARPAAEPAERRTREQLGVVARALDKALTAYWNRRGMHVSVADHWGLFFAEAAADFGLDSTTSESSFLTLPELECALRKRLLTGPACDGLVVNGVTSSDLRALFASADVSGFGRISSFEWQIRLYRLEFYVQSDANDATEVAVELDVVPCRKHAEVRPCMEDKLPDEHHAALSVALPAEQGQVDDAKRNEELCKVATDASGGARLHGLAEPTRARSPHEAPGPQSELARTGAVSAAPSKARKGSLASDRIVEAVLGNGSRRRLRGKATAMNASASSAIDGAANEERGTASAVLAACAPHGSPSITSNRTDPRTPDVAHIRGTPHTTKKARKPPRAAAPPSTEPAHGGDEILLQTGPNGHTLRPKEMGQRIAVIGDGWGGGEGGYEAVVTEADNLTYTVVVLSGERQWEETHVLRKCCFPISSEPAKSEAGRRISLGVSAGGDQPGPTAKRSRKLQG